MSRIANAPIKIPSGVEIKIDNSRITVKGSKVSMTHQLHEAVQLGIRDNIISVKWNGSDRKSKVLAGTTRAILNNMLIGVSVGFEKRLTLVGVGYRATVKGNILNLTLGFSHPINFAILEGITIEAPSQTEIIVRGHDKQQVGQVSAKIRSYRTPEPYKGKGIRYAGEHVVRKDAKKK